MPPRTSEELDKLLANKRTIFEYLRKRTLEFLPNQLDMSKIEERNEFEEQSTCSPTIKNKHSRKFFDNT